jgi:D-alanyl-D-alanine dipeptidase
MVIGLLKAISVIKNLKVDKELTLEKVKEELGKQLSNETKEQLNQAMIELTKPIAEQVNSIIPTLETFGKVLALSQENTPTSRLAILELLTNTKQVEVQVVEQAKEEINWQLEEELLKKETQIELLEKIEMPVE